MAKVETLDNPRDFFEEVTKPCYEEFFAGPTTFKTAFGLAMSLFNIHEWVYEFDKAKLETKFGKPFTSKGVFWKEVEAIEPAAKYIRDLSNASKHVKIGGSRFPTSTGMTHIANTSIHSTAWSSGFSNAFGGGEKAKMRDGAADVLLDDCAKKVYTFWKDLIEELYPTPPTTITLTSGSPTANQ